MFASAVYIGMKAMGASMNPQEIDMDRLTFRKLTAAFVATAFAASLASGPALAQPAAHTHDADSPHKLSLDQGRKWATDEPLRNGMNRIRALVEPRLSAAHAGKLSAAQYRELATQVEAEVGTIVANCKLEPKADAMLHLVIADLVEGTDAMAGKNPKLRPAQGVARVALAVNEYGRHFDHPGFKPIRNIH
jgi:hypothetical protein